MQPADRQRGEGGLLPLIRFALSLSLFLTPVFFLQLYHNMLEQTNCIYANMSAMKTVSAQETQNKNKAANEYSQAHSAAGSKEQTPELEAAAEEEKLLKLSDS